MGFGVWLQLPCASSPSGSHSAAIRGPPRLGGHVSFPPGPLHMPFALCRLPSLQGLSTACPDPVSSFQLLGSLPPGHVSAPGLGLLWDHSGGAPSELPLPLQHLCLPWQMDPNGRGTCVTSLHGSPWPWLPARGLDLGETPSPWRSCTVPVAPTPPTYQCPWSMCCRMSVWGATVPYLSTSGMFMSSMK